MSSRTKITIAAAVALLGIGALVLVPRMNNDTAAAAESADETSDSTSSTPANQTAIVEVATLSNKEEFNADLGFDEPRDLMAQSEGTLTWVPDVGQQITPGEVLWEIDQQPVIYMPGDLPMYRDLYSGVKKGDDVTQLEEFLIAEGYGPEGWVADNKFNSRTRAAVKAFQKAEGMTENGTLGPAQLVVGNDPLRVEVRADKGASSTSGPILSVTSAEAKVTLVATSRQLAVFQKSPEVIIVLGDGTELTATLDKVKSTPADETGAFGYKITYIVDSSISDAQPVKVKIVQVLAADALTVPVDALIALAEGGYAVEVKTSTGNVLKAVQIIDFDNAVVALTGDVAVGDEVVIPS